MEGPDSLLQQPFYVRADAEDKVDLAKAQHAFGQLVADMSRQNDAVDGYQQAFADYKARDQAWQTSRQGPRPVPPRRIVSADLADAGTKELLDVVLSKKPVPPVVANLFDNYVHDSLAGFYIKRWTELIFRWPLPMAISVTAQSSSSPAVGSSANASTR